MIKGVVILWAQMTSLKALFQGGRNIASPEDIGEVPLDYNIGARGAGIASELDGAL